MKKVGIWLAAVLAAFYLTATCAFAQTSSSNTDGAAAAENATAQVQAEEQSAEEQQDKLASDTEKVSEEETDSESTDKESDSSDSTVSEDEESSEEEATEESADEVVDSALRELLDSAELSPETTGNEELDSLVQATLDEIITPEMDVYEQVKACYDYLTSNMRYSWSGGRYYTPVLDTTATALFRSDGRISGYGALALSTNSGQCNDYASAFILLTRALGLDVNLANGRTISAGGGYIRHYWAEMELDGVRYVFDPQLEQSLARYNKKAYTVFGKTYAEVGGRYVYYGTTSV